MSLVLGASVGLLLAFIASLGFAWTMGSCYLSWIPLPERPMCGSRIWGHWMVPLLLLFMSVVFLLVSAWLGASMWAQQLGGARALRQRLGPQIPWPESLTRALDSVGAIRVECVQSRIPLALTVGILQPRVLVSDALVELLTVDELRAVLAHESEHIRRRHPAVYAFARAAARAGAVLPVLATFADRVVLESEIQADDAAVNSTGRRTLARALLKLLDVEAPVHESLAVGGVTGMLDKRIAVLAGDELDVTIPVGVKQATLAGGVMLALPVLFLLVVFLRAVGFIPW